MRVLDLFSGIGGFSIGLERAGMTTVGFCEIDPFCRAVLAKHWPGVPCHDDIRNFDATDFVRQHGPVDVVCGGPPCQPASIAGLRRGDRDERWLWGEAIRVIRDVRPRFVVLENPIGLLRLVREFGVIVASLAESGRMCEWGVLSSAGVGANHKRERVFVLSYADCRNAAQERAAMGRQWRVLCASNAAKVHVIGRNQTTQEPGIPRVANGIPFQIHRNRSLGNSVDPRCVELIGRAIMEVERCTTTT